MDKFSPKERSQIMSLVRSKGNKSTELKLIFFFRQSGIIGWRRNYEIFGKPDFVFMRNRVAVFTDGCFWHGHTCRKLKPGTNIQYWSKKISNNMSRDRIVTKVLKSKGWTVIRIWECQLKNNSILKRRFLQYKKD